MLLFILCFYIQKYLDDMALDKPNQQCQQIMNGHFVKINSEFGLTLDHAKMATNILNGYQAANDQYLENINKKEAAIDAQTSALYAKYS